MFEDHYGAGKGKPNEEVVWGWSRAARVVAIAPYREKRRAYDPQKEVRGKGEKKVAEQQESIVMRKNNLESIGAAQMRRRKGLEFPKRLL